MRASGTSLTGLSGVGPVVVVTVLGEARDITRFPDRNHFAAVVGQSQDLPAEQARYPAPQPRHPHGRCHPGQPPRQRRLCPGPRSSGVSPCSASRSSSAGRPAASSLTRRGTATQAMSKTSRSSVIHSPCAGHRRTGSSPGEIVFGEPFRAGHGAVGIEGCVDVKQQGGRGIASQRIFVRAVRVRSPAESPAVVGQIAISSSPAAA